MLNKFKGSGAGLNNLKVRLVLNETSEDYGFDKFVNVVRDELKEVGGNYAEYMNEGRLATRIIEFDSEIGELQVDGNKVASSLVEAEGGASSPVVSGKAAETAQRMKELYAVPALLRGWGNSSKI